MNILTDQEALDALRMEPGQIDELVSLHNAMATSYVDSRTGFQWEKCNPIDKEAKLCATYVLMRDFFHDKDHDFSYAISDLITELQMKAKALGGNR